VSLSPVAALAGRLVVAEVLQEPSYRRLWVSGLCVNVARWMDLVTVGWLALQLTGSPFMVGLAAFARAAPLMAVGPFAGIVADRMVRGRVLLAAQSVGLATALALAAIFASRAGGYWPLVALEIVFGAMWALDFPARRTALYTILGASRVAQAVSSRPSRCRSPRCSARWPPASASRGWARPRRIWSWRSCTRRGCSHPAVSSGGSAVRAAVRRRPWWRACVRVCRRRGRARPCAACCSSPSR